MLSSSSPSSSSSSTSSLASSSTAASVPSTPLATTSTATTAATTTTTTTVTTITATTTTKTKATTGVRVRAPFWSKFCALYGAGARGPASSCCGVMIFCTIYKDWMPQRIALLVFAWWLLRLHHRRVCLNFSGSCIGTWSWRSASWKLHLCIFFTNFQGHYGMPL